jgi:hypothetical protein
LKEILTALIFGESLMITVERGKHALVFVMLLMLGLFAYAFLPINDDGSEYLTTILTGEYKSLTFVEIGLQENAPLALSIWIGLHELSSFLGVPFIIFGLLLNVCCVFLGFYFWKNTLESLSARMGIREPSHALFFSLFFLSGPIILITCNLYRDAFIFLLVSAHINICFRFLYNRVNAFWFLVASLFFIFALLFLRQAQSALVIAVTFGSIGIKYFSLRVVLVACALAIIGLAQVFSGFMDVGIVREVASSNQTINQELSDGGLSSFIVSLPLLLKVFVLPFYFFSLPIPFGHMLESPRWTDLILGYSSFTNFLLLLFFTSSLSSQKFLKNQFAIKISIIFIMLPLMAIIWSSFQMRHFTPYLPMMILFVAMLNTNKVVSKLRWSQSKIVIFTLFLFAHVLLSLRMVL